jgi:hypothetical protein
MVGVRYAQVSGRGMKPRPPTATSQLRIVRFENGEQHETHLRRSCRPAQCLCERRPLGDVRRAGGYLTESFRFISKDRRHAA